MEDKETTNIPPAEEVKEEPKQEQEIKKEPELSFPNDGPINQKALSPEDIDKLVNEKVDMILGKVVDKLNDKHRKEIDELKNKLSSLDDKLPRTITPRKVEGYYDFNTRTNEFLNEAAKNDYTKAKDTLDFVRSIFK